MLTIKCKIKILPPYFLNNLFTHQITHKYYINVYSKYGKFVNISKVIGEEREGENIKVKIILCPLTPLPLHFSPTFHLEFKKNKK